MIELKFRNDDNVAMSIFGWSKNLSRGFSEFCEDAQNVKNLDDFKSLLLDDGNFKFKFKIAVLAHGIASAINGVFDDKARIVRSMWKFSFADSEKTLYVHVRWICSWFKVECFQTSCRNFYVSAISCEHCVGAFEFFSFSQIVLSSTQPGGSFTCQKAFV